MIENREEGLAEPMKPNATAAGSVSPFVGAADADLGSARDAWMKIYGECHVTASPGGVRTAELGMDSAINRFRVPFQIIA